MNIGKLLIVCLLVKVINPIQENIPDIDKEYIQNKAKKIKTRYEEISEGLETLYLDI